MEFLKRIKSLIESFNQGRIGKSENLILEILKVIDFGINGINFEMKAIGHLDDIDECIGEGENYYPLEGINIAGSLAERYEQLYISANKNKDIIRRNEDGDER